MRRFFTLILIPFLFLTLGLIPFQWVDATSVQPAQVSTAVVTMISGTPIPVIHTSTPMEDGAVYHVVQADEALWSIALAYNTSVEQLKLLNSLSNNAIFIGQTLLIVRPEVSTETPTPTLTVTLGIPTSTVTRPVTATATVTPTPLPVAPISRRSSGMVLGAIVIIALLGAGIGAWLGSKRKAVAAE
ncbi:MAG TPA: LysM peptidoglycan-binding domain-containing protein [Anaerolineales bacterium]|nr:LysM peptidoglycan-binding domain-containing protein [Anaerolineales bacterium]